MDWYTIVSVLIIPAIITGLRMIKLPTKWAPLAALASALVLVAIGKLVGLDLDVNTITDAIIKGLAIAGVSVLGYDTVKKLTTK
jgi:hypothetical protein